MHCVLKTAAIAALCMGSAPAWASADASGGTPVSAIVPAVCDLSADSFVLTSDGTMSGSVQEFCNASTGYQVLAMHRPLNASERASVRYGPRVTNLDASGTVAVAFRGGQRLETVPVEIDARGLSAPLSVAFTLFAV